ncbi:hypothetical protein CYMTET_15081 [Cymbomonas tetramitiformis]|uniref:Uncharacterized protein n=1 Tax=Cymbomonas tetramitiformis TaxID=36881 RepID=A0AAE0L9P4_9CHLO|nr:hypothetical protein CYMTET_15081 [Cymbomonas tetramitiformis]
MSVNREPVRANNWHESLFNCLAHPGNFCISCYLPCIRYGQTAHRADIWPRSFLQAVLLYSVGFLLMCLPTIWPWCGDMTNATGTCIWLPWCGMWYSGIVFIVTIATIKRGELRHKYNISGSTGEDVLVHLCCEPCALAQEGSHVDIEENGHVQGCVVTADIPSKDEALHLTMLPVPFQVMEKT